MKCWILLSTLLLFVLPQVLGVSINQPGLVARGLVARQSGRQQRGGNNNNNGGNNRGNNSNNANDDPQTSLTLDPKVIGAGFANDGQDIPVAGQVASLTSTNNFINFCLQFPGLLITNGEQITDGSCNPVPIGLIPATKKMPSSKFTNPKNGATIPAGVAFTISMAVRNLQTGAFVNAQQNYFAAPQQLNGQGIIIGHSHVVVEALTSLDQTTPTDPTKFAFFKGLNDPAVRGILTAEVTDGLPVGVYRMCSINSSSNHQPVIVPVAQHGSLDDCSYFSAEEAAGNPGGRGRSGGSRAQRNRRSLKGQNTEPAGNNIEGAAAEENANVQADKPAAADVGAPVGNDVGSESTQCCGQ